MIWLLLISVFPHQVNKGKIFTLTISGKERASSIMLTPTTEQKSNAKYIKQGQNLWRTDPDSMLIPYSLETVLAFPLQKSYNLKPEQIE